MRTVEISVQKMNSGGRHEGQAERAAVKEAWVKEAIMSMAVEVCGMKQSKGQQKRTKWWNNEVKEAVRKKKVAYIVWLQQKTSEA